MSTPRKHHSVPQSLLCRFAAPGGRAQLFVYDKLRRRSYPSAIEDAGAERDFYSVEHQGQRLSWEPAFQRLDDRLALLLRELDTVDSLKHLAADMQRDIPLLVATQLLRTKLQRTSLEDIVAQLASIGGDAFDSKVETVSDATSRLQHLRRLLDIDKVAASFQVKDSLLVVARHPEDAFWISDNPVVLQNSFPYGHLSLDAPGIEIYMPIGLRRCLAFFCPSIGRQIRESLDAEHPRPRLDDPLYVDILAGIEHGTPVTVGKNYVDFLNLRQVAQSSRFLYSGRADFDLAEQALANAGAPAVVKSLFTVGRLGEAPPPFRGMPPGAFLIIEVGHNNHALSVTDHTPTTGQNEVVVSTTDTVKLALIQAEAPFDNVTLVVDGQPIQGCRDAVLEEGQRNGVSVLCVRHADPALRALMERISRPPAAT